MRPALSGEDHTLPVLLGHVGQEVPERLAAEGSALTARSVREREEWLDALAGELDRAVRTDPAYVIAFRKAGASMTMNAQITPPRDNQDYRGAWTSTCRHSDWHPYPTRPWPHT